MYGFEEQINLTPSDVLQKISQEQIFEFALEEPIHMGERYRSPCRVDKKPNCRFEVRPDGEILFVDFGEKNRGGQTHRSCFKLVMDKYRITLKACITLICQKFGLSCSPSEYNQPIPVVDMRIVPTDRTRSRITFERKAGDKRDKIFWSESLTTLDQLAEDRVSPISSFTLIKEGKSKKVSLFKPSYAIDFIDQCKIYQPYADPEYKWISSCDENKIGNIDNLPPTGRRVVIKKSYRDHRLIRNLDFGTNVIWFQNEGCVPSLEILYNLTQRFDDIPVFFDNDLTGVLAAIKMCEILNSLRPGVSRVVYLPIFKKSSMLWKDPTSFYVNNGRKELVEVLKYIDIL